MLKPQSRAWDASQSCLHIQLTPTPNDSRAVYSLIHADAFESDVRIHNIVNALSAAIKGQFESNFFN